MPVFFFFTCRGWLRGALSETFFCFLIRGRPRAVGHAVTLAPLREQHRPDA